MLLDYAETDWLGSRPVFYNEKTGKISYQINEVIDKQNISFHPEGLRSYLRFGYSVFGQTPIEDVKFLRYSSRIEKGKDGKLIITYLEDPAEGLLGYKADSGEVLEKIRQAVQKWEQTVTGSIILPLSGGYDSKLLLADVKDKSKIRAYSYGYSKKQEDSFEVVRARKLAASYQIDWKNIKLGEFLMYLDEWDEMYGPAVHAHGMYQMEFYKKICEDIKGTDNAVLSGIIGDGWAGNVRLGEINGEEDVGLLGYAHGLCIQEDICLLPEDRELQKKFYDDNKEKLHEENWRILFAMRMKIMLLRYLMETPRQYGMSAWSPFLDADVAFSMLNLPWKEKDGRLWQKRYFEEAHIEYGWMKKECDYNMIINENALRQVMLEPLNEKLLGTIVKPDYVEWINRVLAHRPLPSFSAKPKTISNIANKLIKKMNADKVKALAAYEVLYPLQKVMERTC